MTPRQLSGLAWRAFLRRWERLRHPGRHRAALRRLAAVPAGGSILVLCLGNICRSPYAAHVLRARLGPLWRVAEGGFIGPDRPSPDSAVSTAAARGVDLSAHRSRLATPLEASRADLLLVMEPRQVALAVTELNVPRERITVLGDLQPIFHRQRAIPDPYGKPLEVFEATYQTIDRCVAVIVDCLDNKLRKS